MHQVIRQSKYKAFYRKYVESLNHGPVLTNLIDSCLSMDQTPLPFEFLQNRTFDTKGTTTVFIQTDHTSWIKRHATLMITACVDGKLRCKPILVFHDSSKVEQQPRKEERKKYHSGVTVYFKPTAYSDEEITMKWIQQDIWGTTSSKSSSSESISSAARLELPQPERLVVLDVFSGQKTKKVLNTMEERNIIPVYIPDGCTRYVLPMDTVLNKLVKGKIADILEEKLEVVEERDEGVGRRRILITQEVGEAWLWLHIEKKESIIKSFKQEGIPISPDGTEDTKLYVRGLPDITVGPRQMEDTWDSDEDVEYMDGVDAELIPDIPPAATQI